MNWETWFQDVAGSVINKAAEAKFSQPYEIDRLRLQALGETGFYSEGQAQRNAGALGGVSPTVLLIGGAILVAVLLMKD